MKRSLCLVSFQLEATSALLATGGTPLFMLICFPSPSLAYELGAAWRIWIMLLVAGLIASAITTYLFWRDARSRDKSPSSILLACSGPATIFMPSALIMGGVLGGAGILFVCLMTLLASFVFWLQIRRRLSAAGSHSRPGREMPPGTS